MLMLQCLRTVSELRCLQGYVVPSSAYWEEAHQIMKHIFLVDRVSGGDDCGLIRPDLTSLEEILPAVPTTCGQLPAGLMSKLHESLESLIAISLGLGTEFLINNASIFLSWHLLEWKALALHVSK